MRSGNYELNRKRLHLEPVLRACVERPASGGFSEESDHRSGGDQPPPTNPGRCPSRLSRSLITSFRTPLNSPLKAALSPFPCADAPEGKGQVTFSDRGPGIPEEDLTRIYDRYYQVQNQGAWPSEPSAASALGWRSPSGSWICMEAGSGRRTAPGGGATFRSFSRSRGTVLSVRDSDRGPRRSHGNAHAKHPACPRPEGRRMLRGDPPRRGQGPLNWSGQT